MRLFPKPLSAEEFRPFGSIAGAGGAESSVNEGRGTRRDLFAAAGEERVVVARYDMLPSALPFRVALLERHPRSDQLFVALNSAEALLVVAPSLLDGTPDVAEAQAFLAGPETPFVYAAGIWHAPLVALGRAGTFLMSMTETNTPADCEVVTLDRSLIVAEAPHRSIAR